MFGKIVRKIILFTAASASFICISCSSPALKSREAEASFIAMDTIMSITCYGKESADAVSAAKEEILRLDNLLSAESENSEVSLINSAGSGVLSEDGRKLMDFSLDIFSKTDGAFDVTVYPVMKLWGFTEGKLNVPTKSELNEVLNYCNSDNIRFDRDSGEIVLSDGQGIDFGGIAKGYASDRLMEIFEAYDIDSAIVTLGGNIQTYHTKPDGSEWNVAIRNPFDDAEEYVGSLRVSNLAVVTSGAYERFFVDEASGKTYHHIIDPSTGYPADKGIASVTIVSSSGILADALSTACYVMGIDNSIKYWHNKDDFDFIIVTSDREVYITKNISKKFTPSDSFNNVHIVQ
ncbi:MAG: FAD:protein FMN transferase [Lachnospiraceae bacterium]